MDTQPNGGRFDGIYGVIAGLEALTALHDAGVTPRRPIEVVAWTNEEGGRFAPGCMGSMAWSNFRRVEDFCRRASIPTACASPMRSPRIWRPKRTCRADRSAASRTPMSRRISSRDRGWKRKELDIGVVTGIQGSRWFTVTLTGETAHAGTTPLALRRDAVQDMVRAITALNALMHDPQDVLRFTVGRVVVEPNTSNSVADRASFTIDFRHPDKDVSAGTR